MGGRGGGGQGVEGGRVKGVGSGRVGVKGVVGSKG